MDFYNALIQVAVIAIPAIFAITLHEAAHGYVARHFGDPTAYQQGRLTLNPIKHIDPMGTIAFPLLTSVMGGIIFGWAKPVPVNFSNLRNPKRDMFWVAAAGPGSNVVQAVAWALIARLVVETGSSSLLAQFAFAVAAAGIGWNVVIALFNLFPLLPLDGGRMLVSVLPMRAAERFSRLEPYGMWALIAFIILLATVDPLRQAFSAFFRGANNMVFSAFGLV